MAPARHDHYGGGDKGGDVRFDSEATIWMETVLLGEPEFIEDISIRNAAFCKEYMSALPEERSISAWTRWFESDWLLVPRL